MSDLLKDLGDVVELTTVAGQVGGQLAGGKYQLVALLQLVRGSHLRQVPSESKRAVGLPSNDDRGKSPLRWKGVAPL